MLSRVKLQRKIPEGKGSKNRLELTGFQVIGVSSYRG